MYTINCREQIHQLVQSNDLLNKIVASIQTISPDWPALMEKFKQTKIGQSGKYDCARLVSLVAELHVQMILQNAAQRFPDRVMVNPPPHPTCKVGYQNDELTILSQTGDALQGIDALVLVDNLPTIFEVKTGRTARTHSRKDPQRAAEPGYVKEHAATVKKAWGKNACGYVLTLFPDEVEAFNLTAFKRIGGQIARFSLDKNTYRHQLYEIALTHGIWREQFSTAEFLQTHYHKRAPALPNGIHIPDTLAARIS